MMYAYIAFVRTSHKYPASEMALQWQLAILVHPDVGTAARTDISDLSIAELELQSSLHFVYPPFVHPGVVKIILCYILHAVDSRVLDCQVHPISVPGTVNMGRHNVARLLYAGTTLVTRVMVENNCHFQGNLVLLDLLTYCHKTGHVLIYTSLNLHAMPIAMDVYIRLTETKPRP